MDLAAARGLRPRRIALIAGPDPGHLLPVAGLANRLAAAGHSVLVVTSSRWAGPLAAGGLAWAELPLPAAAVAGGLTVEEKLTALPVDLTPATVAVLDPFAPELIVGDTLTRVAGLAAGVLGVPWVELVPHPLADPGRGLPPFGTGWWPYRPWRDAPLRRLALRQRRAGLRRFQGLARSRGYATPEPVRRLVATLPALEPPRRDWPATATVVGPLGFETATHDLAPPPGDAPLVLVVGSSASGGGVVDLLGRTVAALGERPQLRVVSPRFDAVPGPLPSWATAGPGRLAPLLAAASVLVAPGGHGMVAAAVLAGLPMVLVPGPGDQKEIAGRVTRLGAGVVAGPDSLAEAIGRVLAGPGFAEQATTAGLGARGLPDPVDLVASACGA